MSEVIVTKGAFSNLTISLSKDITDKLAVTEPADNPLAKVQAKLVKVHRQFEKEYFKLASPKG